MAKQKDNTKLLIIGLLGLAAILLLKQQNRPRYNPQQTYVPPRPVNNRPQAIANWVTSMIQVYGKASELWQPGGPFYNLPKDVQDQMRAMGIEPPKGQFSVQDMRNYLSTTRYDLAPKFRNLSNQEIVDVYNYLVNWVQSGKKLPQTNPLWDKIDRIVLKYDLFNLPPPPLN